MSTSRTSNERSRVSILFAETLHYALVYGAHVDLPAFHSTLPPRAFMSMRHARDLAQVNDSAYDATFEKPSNSDTPNRVLLPTNWRNADGSQWNTSANKRSLVKPVPGNSVTAFTQEGPRLLPQVTLVYVNDEEQYAVRAARSFVKGDVITILPRVPLNESEMHKHYAFRLDGNWMSNGDPDKVEHLGHMCNTSSEHWEWKMRHLANEPLRDVKADDDEFSAVIRKEGFIEANRDLVCGDAIEFYYGRLFDAN